MRILKALTSTEARRWVFFIAGMAGNIAYAIFCVFIIPALVAAFYIMVVG